MAKQKTRFITEDVAEMYGVPRSTVQHWISTNQLSAVKIGKRYYIRQSDLDAFEEARETALKKASAVTETLTKAMTDFNLTVDDLIRELIKFKKANEGVSA